MLVHDKQLYYVKRTLIVANTKLSLQLFVLDRPF